MSMRDVASQVKLREAQIQTQQQQAADIQAQAEQRQRDLADQNTFQELQRNPDVNARIHTGDFSDFEGKIQPKNLLALEEAHANYQKTLLANTAEQNSVRTEAQKEIATTLAGLQSLTGEDGKPDIPRINAALPQALQRLRDTGVLKNAGITGNVPESIQDASQLEDWSSKIGASIAAHEQVIGQQKALADLQNTLSTSRKSSAEAAKIEYELRLMKGGGNQDPTALFTQILGANNPRIPAYVAQWNAAASTGDPLAAKTNVVRQAQEEIGDISKAKQMVPLHEQEAAYSSSLQLGNQKQMAGNNAYRESHQAFTNAQAVASTVEHMLDLSNHGNKAAAAQLQTMLPELVNSVQGIKSGASGKDAAAIGSLQDRLNGIVGGWREGQPIPENIRAELPTVITALKKTAENAHNANVNSINKTFGTGFGISVAAPDGHIYEFPNQEKADAFKQKAGIQ
jgi:hypothetical protein